MALPNSIDAATPGGSDSPALGDDQFRALKTFLEDVLGIPDATSITVAAFSISSAGVVTVSQANTRMTSIELGHATDTTLARASAGDVNIEGNIIYRAGGTDVPVADGGTGVSTLTDGGVLLGSGTGAITAMAVLADGEMIVGDGVGDPVAESGATLRTSIGVGTGDSPQFTSIELGHATDTTLSRSAAGKLAVEGIDAVLLSGAQTLTDKTLTAPIFSGNVAFGTGVLIRKTAQTQVVNNSTTFVNDDALLVALAANETIYFMAHIYHVGNSTADFKYTFTSPSGSTIVFSPVSAFLMDISDGANTTPAVTSSGGDPGTGASTSPRALTIMGSVRNGSTAGNLQFQWAQNTATVVDTYVRTDSFIIVFRQ